MRYRPAIDDVPVIVRFRCRQLRRPHCRCHRHPVRRPRCRSFSPMAPEKSRGLRLPCSTAAARNGKRLAAFQALSAARPQLRPGSGSPQRCSASRRPSSPPARIPACRACPSSPARFICARARGNRGSGSLRMRSPRRYGRRRRRLRPSRPMSRSRRPPPISARCVNSRFVNPRANRPKPTVPTARNPRRPIGRLRLSPAIDRLLGVKRGRASRAGPGNPS